MKVRVKGRFAAGARYGTAEERFLAKVEKTATCWNWVGSLNSSSYGVFGAGGRNNLVLAHRWSYERYVGPIPAGLTLDHFACQNTRCVNPTHLDPCSIAENNRRRAVLITHCKRGHHFAGENLRIRADGKRTCNECHRTRALASWRRKHRRKIESLLGPLFAAPTRAQAHAGGGA